MRQAAEAWQAKAACRGPQSAAFFPPSHAERKDEKLQREERAKAICRTCVVRRECLDYAIRIREPHGIWGGLNELERKGLIERVPHRGATVRDLTPHEVLEIYAVREEVEVMAARILPFPVAASDLAKLEQLQREHSAAVDAGDMLTVFYANLHFHQTLFGLCGNACLIETIEYLAQKVYGIRSYANAFPEALDRARRDHVDMIKALRASRREQLIALMRRHLQPSPAAYIRAYERRFGHGRTFAVR